MRRIRQRLTIEVRSLRGSNATTVIRRLNPIIRGWAAYYRGVVAKEMFSAAGQPLVAAPLPVGAARPPEQAEEMGCLPLLRPVQPVQADRWVFGDRDSGAYLRQFAWTKIVRTPLVMGTASTDDPALDRYWAQRRRNSYALLGGATSTLLIRQRGRCPACGTLLLHAEQEPQSPHDWEQWSRTVDEGHAQAGHRDRRTAAQARSDHPPSPTRPLQPQDAVGPARSTEQTPSGLA